MGTKPVLKEIEFENQIGQTIKPGDPVVIITSGYNHSVNIKEGEYLGKKNDGVHCRVQEYRNDWRHKETGDIVQYSWISHSNEYYGAQKYPKRDHTIRYGSPGYKEDGERWQNAYNDYLAEAKRRADQYEKLRVPDRKRLTTLQLNRIFKIDTPLSSIQKI